MSLDPLSDFLQMALLAPSSTIPFVPQCTAYNLCDSLDWEEVLSDNEHSDTLAHAKIAHLTQLLAQRDVELSQKDAELAQKETEISFYDAELARKDIELERKNTDLDRKDAELAQRDAELERKNTELAQKNAELAQRDTELAQKNAELAQRDTELAQRDTELAQCDTELAQKNAELAQRDTELAQRDTELAQLLSQRDEESARNAVVINDVAQELLSAKQELAQREMEVKRKEEEEAAALKMEQERELAIKEKKELDAVFSLFRDARSIYSNNESNVEYAFKNLDENECKFLRSLEESGETILLVSTLVNQRRCPYSQQLTYENTPLICNVLTNCHFYDFTYTSFIKKNSTSTCVCPNIDLRDKCNSLKTGIFYVSKLYSFTNPLNLVHAKILLSLVSIPKGGGKTIEVVERPPQSIFYCLYTGGYNKLLESIIRLIPGSYKNGSWRQLDGFFGMYFNETTMEVSTIPPPHE